MRTLTFTICLLMSVSAAQARDFTCNFTTECFDLDGCNETAYELELNEGVLSDVNGDQEVRMIEEDGFVVFATGNQQPFTLVTITESEDARMTIVDGATPYTIVYGGSCTAK